MTGYNTHPSKAARANPSLEKPREPVLAASPFPVVGIGASAGGLDACRKVLDGMPAASGMAFILVQHLDPTHESLMVDLLAGHTAMVVREAGDGMPIERDHLYVIPPGVYLSVAGGALHVSLPGARHGARLPIDFLLHSLAQDCGAASVAVILSGTGADGSLGLQAVKAAGGLVVVQDPGEAGYDGMPRNAILTGAVDQILSAADIAEVLIRHSRNAAATTPGAGRPADAVGEWLPKIIELLRTRTAPDFTLYKQGTLQRRIERRMALAAIEASDVERYLDILKGDTGEIDLLAKDLLINVTSFFRDPKVYDALVENCIAELVRERAPDHPLRVWIAGCSTGEEAYSIGMLFREQIAASKRAIKLQIFASDVDQDAVAFAREGLYPQTIEAEVSPARLAQFFTKETTGYRVLPELRSAVVFTIQDVLLDPPFSRLDLISCRNLLIYLQPEAQAKVISLFHFALREGGMLLLGVSETIGGTDGRFEAISKPDRLYRHIGRSRPGEFGFLMKDGIRASARPGQPPARSRQADLADLCRRLVLESYAPAAVLINAKHECVYSLGPTERYLRVAPGYASNDFLAMAPQGQRSRLRAAIQRAFQDKVAVAVAGGDLSRDGQTLGFTIDIKPVRSDDEEFLLVCFVEETKPVSTRRRPALIEDVPRVVELEQELDIVRKDLQAAIRNLEYSSEEQKTINEEALSVNEEYQSTNEELLTSKEELQSLNEELTALNSQLQETLELQRTTSNDLQNVLNSTDMATLFLDKSLKIRLFTPATKALFNVIASDVGRPLADLNSLAVDASLPDDARAVLQTLAPIEREIEARGQSGEPVWFVRRILPYRTTDDRVDGVVITFTDITERKRVSDALEVAKRQAQQANAAKSRFLAAASHDLRQPLQTLALLQGLLAKLVEGDKAKRLVARLDEALGAMSGMLNTLLDINQIEAGAVQAEKESFQVNDLLDRLKEEYSYHAQAQGLVLHVVACSQWVHTDPRLLEQMLRNLLSNALKYTKHGKVLLGCRRHAGHVSIQVWDTGIGIEAAELKAIFDEYHQVGNAARELSLGLGLGLSIVQRLGALLDHRIDVHSQPGKGSVFTIDVAEPAAGTVPEPWNRNAGLDAKAAAGLHRIGGILVVEDDPEVRELLGLFLKDEGQHAVVARDGATALDLVAQGKIRPDLLMADFNLPGCMNGLQLAAALRQRLQRPIPAIILTGDISTETLRDIALNDCLQLNKPVKLTELTQAIQRLLPVAMPEPDPKAPAIPVAADVDAPVIFVVDDDRLIREGIRSVLEDEGLAVEDFATCEAFLAAYRPGRRGCLLVDAYLPGMNGLELLQQLSQSGHRLPAIMITGSSDVPMAVQAMKAGATDFIEKPIGRVDLLASVERALEQSADSSKLSAWRETAATHVAGLTARQRQIMDMVLAGHPSKNIAADLGVSQRTVENHRAAIMKKMGTKSLPALARMALAAGE